MFKLCSVMTQLRDTAGKLLKYFRFISTSEGNTTDQSSVLSHRNTTLTFTFPNITRHLDFQMVPKRLHTKFFFLQVLEEQRAHFFSSAKILVKKVNRGRRKRGANIGESRAKGWDDKAERTEEYIWNAVEKQKFSTFVERCEFEI